MKKGFLILSILISQTFAFSQDSKVSKIAKYLEKGKGTEAKELLDEIDNNPKYKTDIDYWYVRTCLYKAFYLAYLAKDNDKYKTEIIETKTEAKKSFEKLVEYDKTDTSKSYSEVIPQLRKEIYNGENETVNKSSNNSPTASSKTEGDAKTVTLTEIGQGKTKEAAKYSALRSVLEKSFGTFISSNTSIFKDELAKDEIVSISSGNIQNFEILSETQMPDGSYTIVLKATVSIGKLTKFCESKGITVEFKGGLFTANIKLQELNKKNEEAVMSHLFIILKKIVAKGFDFTIDVNEPTKENFGEKWSVKYTVKAKANSNLLKIKEMILNTINNICLTPQDIATYSNQNLSKYKFEVNGKSYYFRSLSSWLYLKTVFEKKIPLSSIRFSVSDGLNTSTFVSTPKTSMKIEYYIPRLGYENRNEADGADIIPIAEFLQSINESNYQQINNSVNSEYNNANSYFSINLGQLNNPKSAFSSELAFKYQFTNTYTMEQLSKLTEFKVQPLN